MKLSLLSGVVLAVALAGCHSSPRYDSHWSNHSIRNRVSYQFLGYDPSSDGDYLEHDHENKQALNLTLRRHFLNSNPENPLQPDDPDSRGPRPVNSLFPNPVYYLNDGGIGSIVGTLNPGGMDEFMDGVETTFRPLGVVTLTFADYTIGEKGPIRPTITTINPFD